MEHCRKDDGSGSGMMFIALAVIIMALGYVYISRVYPARASAEARRTSVEVPSADH